MYINELFEKPDILIFNVTYVRRLSKKYGCCEHFKSLKSIRFWAKRKNKDDYLLQGQ
jgi:hypothetical protein